MAKEKLWFKDPNYGKLEKKARKSTFLGSVGTELKGAADYAGKYWSKKITGAKRTLTRDISRPASKSREQMDKLDSERW